MSINRWMDKEVVHIYSGIFSSVQFSCSVISDTLWPHGLQQASMSITNSQSSLKPMSIESVMPSSHLILCCPPLLLPSIFPRISIFSNESALGHKKEHIWVSSNEVDEPRAYYIEWSKSERGKQLLYINAYIENLERWHWWTHLQGSSGDAGMENRPVDTVGKGEGGVNSESSVETCILPCVR